MRIKKTSQTTTTQAQVVDGYSTSTIDSYSCNYANNIIKKNIMTIYIIQNTDVSDGSTIPFTNSKSVGSKLTFESNGIRIGTGISKIKINITVGIRYSASTSQVYGATLLINGNDPTDNSGNIVEARAQKSIGEPISASSGERLIDVSEGDLLTVKIVAGATCPCTPNTFVTVEVVE